MDTVPAATNGMVTNLTLILAGTEYSQVLNDGQPGSPSVKAIMFRLQDKTQTCQYAFKSGGPYFDLLAGEVYWKDGLDMYAASLYFKSTFAGAVVDIEVWN